jgi:hypothetical protein
MKSHSGLEPFYIYFLKKGKKLFHINVFLFSSTDKTYIRLEQYYFELILLNVVYKLHIKPTWQSRMEYRETPVRLGQDTDRRYTKRNIQHRNPPNKLGGGG